MRIPFILLLFFSFFLPAYAYCGENKLPAENKEKEVKKTREPFLKEWLKEELEIWTSPARIKKKNILFLGGLALTTSILIKNDERLYRDVQDFTGNHQLVKDSSPVITQLGSVPLNIGVMGSFYLVGALLKDDRAKDTARLGLKSLLHAIVVSQVLKRLFRRQRPYVENGVDRWFNRGSGYDNRAFPSGHTTLAWSTATVIAGMYKDKPAVPIICYSLATLAGLSRMTENKHWASDVLVGTVLGYSIGRFVLRKQNNRLMVTPVINSRKVGLNLLYVF
ncbi:MAG: phosphatase PAP2 family protein [Candidatus Aminicenantes bacterium]|nr:phosphatase PAP2 family protein [Candidatus Aminicenantes bacterium]NIM77802.1 phosphatase PAP2 family protein [Candidatus Aminicenantes bacterium]NIN17115.1 phosphatase PAP2 family protein [Candidatus Aminicenantes bacterium]NIN41008.1 phosphatase PAP2 family protein [Candidatus Aminicenantes bacterium]NIN83813.1 phosphatase PAP2 family protein [Candidatus Aminicenantes bacterium]